jgi:hypothetical protein
MIRLGGRGLRATICLVLAATSFSACTDIETSLFISGNLYAAPPSCTVDADPSATLLGRGRLDLAFSHTYTAALLVGNQLTARGDKSQLRPETKRVSLQGAEVILTDLAGRVIEPAFSVPGAGFADVNDGPSPGYGVIFADVIPRTVGTQLAEQVGPGSSPRTVIAEIRVFGTALGGHELESAPFIYPIEVCYGCLVQFPLAAMAIDPNGNFVCGADPEGATDEVPCTLGQDGSLDCRSCVASYPEVCLTPL